MERKLSRLEKALVTVVVGAIVALGSTGLVQAAKGKLYESSVSFSRMIPVFVGGYLIAAANDEYKRNQ